MPEHRYRITYFPARGLAEMSRMVLAYANVPFEDERLDAESMNKRRGEFPYGRLPVLVIDGRTTLAESCAIARYLAKQFGLAGKDDIEACIVDGVADVQKDIGAACASFFAVASGRQQGDKEQLKQDVLIPTLDKFMPLLQKQLEASGSGFYATSGPTWVVIVDLAGKTDEEMAQVDAIADLYKDFEILSAKFRQSMEKFMPFFARLLANGFFMDSEVTWVDFLVCEGFQSLKNVEPEVIKEYPFALKFIERVYMLSELKTYIENRPHSDF
ncbi:Glutathione S-transferase protein [Aphelenchoides besseyi]|nr:Glutathione S-transferase protein [Aphelenchoides besseyi]